MISIILRAYIWYYFRAYIDIEAIQISPLAGRVFLKGVCYYGQNETIKIGNGYITWKYWLRHVRHVDWSERERSQDSNLQNDLHLDGRADELNADGLLGERLDSDTKDRSPRITIHLRGLEWFVYNRSPAYDAILVAITNRSHNGTPAEKAAFQPSYNDDSGSPSQNCQTGPESREEDEDLSPVGNSEPLKDDFSPISHTMTPSPQLASAQVDYSRDLPSFIKLLPIGIQCKKGALVMGNEHTQSILVAKLDQAQGSIDAGACGPQDLYRQSFDFELQKFTASFRANQDYTETPLNAGSRRHSIHRKAEPRRTPIQALSKRKLRKHFLRNLGLLVPQLRHLVGSVTGEGSLRDGDSIYAHQTAENKWMGLSRYLDEEEDELIEQEKWKAIEYAEVNKIVDCPKMTLSFFYDVPGKVVVRGSESESPSSHVAQNINGSSPPEWGMNVTVGGGLINYGPWADRQRADIQTFFFPQSFTTAPITRPLEAGQLRQSTQFKVEIILDDSVVLRTHTREESKDWKWKGHLSRAAEAQNNVKGKKNKQKKNAKENSDAGIRPAGWMELTVAANSCVKYSMDLFASSSGFENNLTVDVPSLQLSTSVNHGLLLRSGELVLGCDLSNPLNWNAQRAWNFDIHWESLELFLLRDHTFLFIDLINDWTSGPSQDYFAFIPFLYSLRIQLPLFRIYLNINDANIIDSPAALDANAFIVLGGDSLTADLSIPMNKFRPLQNEIEFSSAVSNMYMELLTPTWNTLHTFLSDKTIAKLDSLIALGSYTYYTSTSPSQTETLVLDLHGIAPTIQLFGYLIRYFIVFRENYFGEDMHFQTLEEHQQKLSLVEANQLSQKEERHTKLSNDLDVILTIRAEDASVELPSEIYSAQNSVSVVMSLVNIDLRFTNYYMDIEIQSSPLAFSRQLNGFNRDLSESNDSNTQVFIDGIALSGHRLFGLPPTEPTYVCNWDLDVGTLSGECSAEFLALILRVGSTVVFQFKDAENVLPPIRSTELHDITFLRVGVDSIKLWVHVKTSALLMETDSICLYFNDWARQNLSEYLCVKIPMIVFSVMEAALASRRRTNSRSKAVTFGAFQASVELRLAISKANFRRERQIQQNYVEAHDLRTKRTPWLLLPFDTEGLVSRREPFIRPRPPAMSVPLVPEPLHLTNKVMTGNLGSPELTSSELVYQKSSSFRANNCGSSETRGNVPTTLPNQLESSLTKASRLYKTRNPGITGTSQVLPEHNKMHPNVAFSSPFDLPYFPLQHVSPDLNVLPFDLLPLDSSDPDNELPGDDTCQVPEDDIVRTSVSVSFGSAIHTFWTSDALSIANDLSQALQPTAPEQVLDEIQKVSMSSVIDKMSRRPPTSRFQIQMVIPAIVVRLSNQSISAGQSVLDQTYEIVVTRLKVTAGYGLGRQQNCNKADSANVALKGVRFIARTRSHGLYHDDARVELGLDTMTLWLFRDTRISSQLQVKCVQITSLNKKVEYIAALLKGTIALIDGLHEKFATSINLYRRRRQIVVHSLVSQVGSSADPVFLTTGSYILRAVSNHPRLSDTWKMFSRLRSILVNLPLEESQRLGLRCLDPPFQQLPNELDEVVFSFNRWRAWDLVQVKSSAFIQEVFDVATPEKANLHFMTGLEIGLNIDAFMAVIDPGPEQNEIVVKQLFTSVNSSIETDSSVNPGANLKRKSMVIINCDQTLLRLNLEICDFLGGVLNQINLATTRTESQSIAEQPSVTHASGISSELWHAVHLVVALERVDLSLKSINLTATSLSQYIKGSLLVDREAETKKSVNAMFNAHYVATRLSTQLRSLALIQIVDPSLHGALDIEERRERQARAWRSGAFCGKIGLEIHEDILGLLGVIDILLKDELTYVMKIKSLTTPKRESSPNQAKDFIPRKETSDSFVATFLLDEYSITTALLSSLRYVVRGNVARSTFVSFDELNQGFQLDFDFKEHYHSLENHVDQSTEEISGFILPPLNGQVAFTRAHDVHSAAISMVLEKITMDASALYSIITTVSRQEISHFSKDFTRDLAIVESNYQGLFGGSLHKTESPSLSAMNLQYKISLVASGLKIAATTGKSSPQAAQLSFRLGCMSFHMHNSKDSAGHAPSFPEIKAEIGEVKVLLERSDGRSRNSCGDVTLKVSLIGTSKPNERSVLERSFEASVVGPEINLFADTAPTIVDILGYIQQKLKTFNLTQEIRTLRARRHRSKSQAKLHSSHSGAQDIKAEFTTILFNSMYNLEVLEVQVSWRVGDLVPISPGHEVEDLVFSIERIHLSTRKTSAARLVIGNLQLQMVPSSQPSRLRSNNSALMPEVVFNAAYLSTSKDRRLTFQAVGKSLDLRLTPHFVLPASDLQRSIGHATEDLRKVVAGWNASLLQDEQQDKKLFGNKKLSSILVDADFAGAVVYLQKMGGSKTPTSVYSPQHVFQPHSPQDRALQSPQDSAYSTVLRTPGIAFKIQYQDVGEEDPSLNAEIKVDASSNTLQPTVVPLVLELISSVQEIVQEKAEGAQTSVAKTSPAKQIVEDPARSAYPVAILGNCKLNLGLRICGQKFGLTCQPIAKVAAIAEFDDIYVTVNTVQGSEQDRFFALSARVIRLQTSVQHAYSQESTGSFVADLIELSLMNSKHVSDLKGISAILNLGPMKVMVNAKQIHDFFLFREIWVPRDVLQQESRPSPPPTGSHPIMVQRYQQTAAASPYPWSATISIAKLDVDLDLGSSLGKSSFQISKLWTSSHKFSNWEQDLCLGFDEIKAEAAGRLSCLLELQNMRLRTSIKWEETDETDNHTPLIQASIGFQDLRLKAAFEYQSFLIATFSALDFLMYNVRDSQAAYSDRLVCTVEGDQVQAYCTTQSSAQLLALYQSFQRLVQEKKQAYENSMKEIRRFYRTEGGRSTFTTTGPIAAIKPPDQSTDRTPLQLQTNVVVSLKYINIGAYPRSFVDSTIFKLNALDASARFSVLVKDRHIHSSLGLSLGQVRVALSPINLPPGSNAFEDISVDDVVRYSMGSRGGTILKVPRVVAIMQTWQEPRSTQVEYIFRSSFEGKVEVGWNINRINVIRSMWNSHSHALAGRLGKALPHSAVQITGVPTAEGESKDSGKEKITAVVNVPLSRYSYNAREPPVIETPQLRDMGEATPPLEWIGLHRDRLPNITHQIIIVPLLEVAKEVEDAYGRILGTS